MNFRRSLSLRAMVIVLSFGFAGPGFAADSPGFDHAHSGWATVLKKGVSAKGRTTQVDYKGLKAEPSALISYLRTLEAVTQAEYDAFTEAQKLAFLINAYNALTVKLIVDHYPVKSIKDIGSVFSSAWKQKFFTLLGQKRDLDNIEHDMIRKNFNEPRIHFSIVCASVGCPALRAEPFVAARLESQLESSTHDFISDPSRNRYLSDSKTLEISSIFDWYDGDFVKKFGSLESFLADRITDDPAQRKIIREKKAKIRYLDYDWSLNELK
jgi:hypothetical protein